MLSIAEGTEPLICMLSSHSDYYKYESRNVVGLPVEMSSVKGENFIGTISDIVCYIM